MKDITVILNCYKRPEYLQEQILSIKNQTIPIKEIMIWSNRPEDNTQYNLDNLGVKVAYANYNFKFHARFAFGLLAQTEYVAFFDDDTIPGPKWFENCLKYIEKENLILGSSGVRYLENSYHPHIKIGWNGDINNKTLEYVDLVGHSWFMKRSTLQFLWYEDPISWENGEDIQLSGFAFKYGGIKTAVPPHDMEYTDSWGSVKGLYGLDKHASHYKFNHSELRNNIVNSLITRGYIKVIDRNEK